MEGMAYIQHSSVLSGAEYSTDGYLTLVQKQPLRYRGVDDRYNVCSQLGSNTQQPVLD